MRRFFENKLVLAATVLAFAAALSLGGAMAGAPSQPQQPAAVLNSELPTFPPCTTCPPDGGVMVASAQQELPTFPPCTTCPPDGGASAQQILPTFPPCTTCPPDGVTVASAQQELPTFPPCTTCPPDGVTVASAQQELPTFPPCTTCPPDGVTVALAAAGRVDDTLAADVNRRLRSAQFVRA